MTHKAMKHDVHWKNTSSCCAAAFEKVKVVFIIIFQVTNMWIIYEDDQAGDDDVRSLVKRDADVHWREANI